MTWDYNYDWLNRLAEVKRDGDTTSLYAYDESDNRIELQLPQDDKVWTYGYDIADRIQSRSLNISGGGAVEYETFEHDDDGNMTSRTLSSDSTVTAYNWDADNRLVVTLVGGSFAADGIRRSGYQAGEGYSSLYFSSGGMSLSEQARDGTSLSFIQGHQILGLNDGTDLFYHISDGLGSVRLIVDEDGDAVASFSSDEFGVEENSSGTRTDLNYMTYTGALGVRKDPTGLYYARQRYYDSSLGRWLSADPIGFAGGLNLYTYVGQNPINAVDPSGLMDPKKMLDFAGKTWEIVTSATEPAACEAVEGFGLRGLLGLAAGEAALPLTLVGLSGYGAYRVLSGPSPNGAGTPRTMYVPSGPVSLPGLPGADTNYQRFVPNEYYREACQQRAPRQSGPYTIRLRSYPDGGIKQATTYDQFGRRANQFDFGGRHGDEVHPFVYPPEFINPEGLRTLQVFH